MKDAKIEEEKSSESLDMTGKPMAKEYGLLPKGKEPTRYGDWEIKGKCVDF